MKRDFCPQTLVENPFFSSWTISTYCVLYFSCFTAHGLAPLAVLTFFMGKCPEFQATNRHISGTLLDCMFRNLRFRRAAYVHLWLLLLFLSVWQFLAPFFQKAQTRRKQQREETHYQGRKGRISREVPC